MKNFIKIVFILIIIFTLPFLVNPIFFSKSDFTCGKFIEYSSIKGANYIRYTFSVNGEEYAGSIRPNTLREGIGLDSLKKLDCIRIEYSEYTAEINRVIDNRIFNK